MKKNEDLRIMWTTFHHHETRGLIKVDVTLAKSIVDILKMLKRLNHLYIMKSDVKFCACDNKYLY